MAAVQVVLVPVVSHEGFLTFLPRTAFAPLPELAENCFITEHCIGEDCLGGYEMPLAAGLELVHDALDDLSERSLLHL